MFIVFDPLLKTSCNGVELLLSVQYICLKCTQMWTYICWGGASCSKYFSIIIIKSNMHQTLIVLPVSFNPPLSCHHTPLLLWWILHPKIFKTSDHRKYLTLNMLKIFIKLGWRLEIVFDIHSGLNRPLILSIN